MIVPFDRRFHYAFVLDSWIRSARKLPAAAGVDDATFNVSFGNAVVRMISEDEISLVVDDEDPDAFLGFAARKGDVLHYVYVKEKARKCGVARELVEASGCTRYVFKPRFEGVQRRLLKGMTYDPFAALS